MSENKLGQEPAFPLNINRVGMSKRFYAACAAMQGQVSKQGLSYELNQLKRDVEYALLYA